MTRATLRRRFGWVAVLGVLSSTVARAQQAPAPPLAELQFDIIGVRLVVDPPALTVPKNIATQINTSLLTPQGLGSEVSQAIATLTSGAQVEAELRGPSLAPTRIAVVPGQPLPIPPLAIPGDYFLDGIRLVKNGQTVLDATAQDGRLSTTIPIKVINEVFVASVTSRPLALDEIRSRGIVIDEKNFSAVNFQVAFNIDGTPFTISAPAVLPTPELLQTRPDRTELIRQISGLNRALAGTQASLPPQFDRPGLNFSIAPLPFFPVLADDSDRAFDTPPVTGLIVIPGNVAFLNQFFSALLLVANVAPDGTPLVLRDVTGTITLPKGLDRVAGTFDAPGDDPLRLARIDGVGLQPIVAIAQRGPDGKLGTADDIFIVPPQRQGEGEFLIEGLAEGSHTFDIAIDATLTGLPSGPVRLQGEAAGAVFVRNPTFAVTLAHPRTVRSGEPYTIYATVTNTSKTPANLVSVNLDPRGITGAELLSDPTVTLDSIAPGQSAVAKYSLKAQLTGEVTFASFTGDTALGGGIRLETGVDERGVALAANAIVLPRSADFLPASFITAAQRVLGQAFSVATAPAEALPEGVLFVKRQTVVDRGIELAEAGERVKLGEPLGSVVRDLLLDWLGNTTFDDGFDQIVRTTDAGADLLREFAAMIAPDTVAAGVLEYQHQFAQAAVTRNGHLSAIAAANGGAPAPELVVTRASGGSIGLDGEGGPSSSLPSAALLALNAAGNAATLGIVARPEAVAYVIELRAPDAGIFDLGVVVPVASLGQLRQLRFNGIGLDAGGSARVVVDLGGTSPMTLSIDRDGDGTPESVATPGLSDVVAGPAQVVAVRQLESSSRDDSASLFDPAAHGLLVGTLFDRPVTKESAESKANYHIDSNEVIGAQLQHSARLVYLYLQKPIGNLTPRSLTVSNLVDSRGTPIAQSTTPIQTILGDGAHVFGQVRDAGGSGVAGAVLKLTVVDGPKSFDVSSLRTDLNGGFDFDFVRRIGERFVLTAQHPVTRDLTTVSAQVHGFGEQILINPTFTGRGTVRGRVLGTDGVTPVASIPVALIPGSVLGSRGFNGRTNAVGEFTFVDVPAGVFTLSGSDGVGGFGQATGLIARGGDVVTRDLTLVTQPDEGGTLTGRVFASDGATPEAGFTVYVGRYNRDGATIEAIDQSTTDASGTFAFARSLTPGSYDVVAVDPSTQQLGSTTASISARNTTSVSIVLESTGAVEGVVFNGRGDRVAGALVAGGVALVSTDSNGFFRIDGVPAGLRTIEAGDPVTRRRGSSRVSVLPGQTVAASITLESRATITGRVLDAGGNPVPGASVRIPAIDGYTFVIANNQGVFTLPDLTLGDYLIQAPGPSKESLISFMEANGIDPRSAFTSGDGPDSPAPPASSNTNAVLAAYQKAVQAFFSVDESLIDGLPMAAIGGFGWNKVALFQDATTVVADIRFLPMGSVSGTTVDAGSRPTGAAVRVSALKVSTTGFPQFGELTRTNTDPADGRFSFGGIARFDLATFQATGVRGGDFTLEAATPFSPVHPQFRGQLSTATPNQANIVLQFPAAADTNGTVSGQIFLPDGVTPVPAGSQVRISFGDLLVTTDGEGKFRSLLPIPAGPYTITAQTPSGLRGQTLALVVPGANVDIRMRVLGLGAVTLTVTRPNGAPVANAHVSVLRADFPGDRAEGTTNASGVLRLVNITEGAFSATAEEAITGLAGRASAAIARDGEIALPIVITGSGTVTGTFLSADGSHPIAFAQVVLASGGTQAYGTTDNNGRFAIAAVPLGSFTAEGFDPLTNRRGRATGALQFEAQTVDVTILQAPRGSVTGFVVNADGVRPVPAARVTLRGSSFIETRLQATALADGSFRFDGIPSGTFTIDAIDPVSAFAGSTTGNISFEGQTVDANVTLAPFGSVHVTVTDAAGHSVSNASVSIAGRQGPVDTNGEITFENLALGPYHLVARSLADANDGGEATTKIESANQVVDAAIRFRGTGSVTVTVVPSSGSGVVASAEVTLTATGSSGGNPSALATTLSGFTNGAGTVTFPSVPVGDFAVRAEAAALAGLASGSLAGDGSTASVQVQLGASGTVTGRLLLPDGVTPAAGAFATLRFQSQSSLQSGVVQIATNLTGNFEFRGIPIGSFTFSAIEVASSGVRSVAGAIATDGENVNLGTLTLDNTAPRIVQVSPADRASNVGPRDAIAITFSEPIARAQLIVSPPADNVALFEGSVRVPLAPPEFSQDGRIVSLRPARDLTSGALVTLTVKGAPDGPRDEAQFVLLDPFVSTFTVRDSIAPTVVAASPASGAQQVPLDAVARITFSEPVAGVVMSLVDGSNQAVPGTLTLAAGGTTAVFAPLDFLRANTTYTIRVPSAADTAGNPLAGGVFAASFATVDTNAPTISAMQIVGTPRSGATVVARPTIADSDLQRVEFSVGPSLARVVTQPPFEASLAVPANVPSTTVTAVAFDVVGNRSSPFVLTVPIQANAAPIVTLRNVGGSVSVGQSDSVTFEVHATDDDQLAQILFSATGAVSTSVVRDATTGQTDVTQTFMVTVPASAVSNSTFTVQAAATDAAGGHSAPVTQTLSVRDGSRPTVSVQSPVNNALVVPGQTVDVVVDAADDVALASVALTCNPQVTGCNTRTLNGDSAATRQTFNLAVPGTLQAPQTLSLSIIATDSSGNTGFGARVLQIADIVSPTISALETVSGPTRVIPGEPAGLRATVADNVGVTAMTFTTDGAFTTGGTIVVSPAIVAGATTFAVPVPAGVVNGSTVTVHLRVRDASNNLSDERTLILTIGDSAAPVLTVLEPAEGASIAPGGTITVRAHATDDVAIRSFSLAVSGALAAADARDVVPATTPADVTFSVPVPQSTAAGVVAIVVEAMDTLGNSSGVVQRHVTIADTVAPQVQITAPAVNVSFDPRNPISVTVAANDAVGVSSISLSASGAVTSSETRVIAPAAASRTETFTVNVTPLPISGGTVTLSATALDAAGNMGSAVPIAIRINDVVAPDIIVTTPADGAAAVDPHTTVVVRFSEPIEPATANPTSIQLQRGTSVLPASIVVGGNDDVVTVTPAATLALNTTYRLVISTAVTDRSAIALAAPRTITFTTASPDTVSPRVQSVDPGNNATGVSLATPITVTFSEALDTSTITNQSFHVRIGSTSVAGSFSFLNGNATVRFAPTEALATDATVVTELTAAIADPFGNPLAADDGSALTAPLAFTFTTGQFSLTSPAAATVVENQTLILEARASAALGVSNVVFTVNGTALPATAGPPFVRNLTVGSAASTPVLTIVASARNSANTEIAHDERTVTVVPGLTVSPSLGGIPLDGSSTLRFALSSASEADVPITLAAGDPSLVTFPVNPVVLPAGQTSIDATVAGAAVGATAVIGSSSRGAAAAVVAVSPIQHGQMLSPFASPTGMSLSNPPAAGIVVAPAGATRTVRVSILSVPGAAPTAVTVVSTNNAAAVATASVIAAGELTTELQITTLSDGVATLILRAGNEVRGFTVFVGAPPPGSTPLLVAAPVGLSISRPPIAAQVVAASGRHFTLAVQVLSVPASVDTPVLVSSSNASVASATSGVVRAGETAATLTIDTVADGSATFTIRAGDQVRAVSIFVGVPPAGSAPLLVASPVGVSIAALPTLGRAFAPLGATRTLTVRLLQAPAAVDTPVTVISSDGNVASVTGATMVRAGERVANLNLATGSAGSATLTIEAGGTRSELTVVVGTAPTPGSTPPIVAAPVGVTVIPNPSIGRVFSQPGAPVGATLGIPLLAAPSAGPTSVSVRSSNTDVASIGGGATATVTIETGGQVLQLPVAISGSDGAALLTFEFNGQRRELLIIIGNPPASEIPAVTAPVVGIRIG